MKYIDADKLKAEIDKRMGEYDVQQATSEHPDYEQGAQDALYNLKLQLASLQQDQQDFPTTDEEIEMLLATHPKVEVPQKYKTPDWLWKKQEQPEVDLEKDIESWFFNEISPKINIEHTMYYYFQECARRYFELGLKARKEK